MHEDSNELTVHKTSYTHIINKVIIRIIRKIMQITRSLVNSA